MKKIILILTIILLGAILMGCSNIKHESIEENLIPSGGEGNISEESSNMDQFTPENFSGISRYVPSPVSEGGGKQENGAVSSEFVGDIQNLSLEIIENSSNSILTSVLLRKDDFDELKKAYISVSLKSTRSSLAFLSKFNKSDNFIVRECASNKQAGFYMTFQNENGTKMFLFFVKHQFDAGILPYRVGDGYVTEKDGKIYDMLYNNSISYDEFVKLINPIDL